MIYLHSYTLQTNGSHLNEQYVIKFNSDSDIPTEREFFEAVHNEEKSVSKDKILNGEFAFIGHVVFKQ